MAPWADGNAREATQLERHVMTHDDKDPLRKKELILEIWGGCALVTVLLLMVCLGILMLAFAYHIFATTREDITMDNEAMQRWLESRKTFVGASESPVLFNEGFANQSAFSVWYSKQPGYKPEKHDPDLQWRFDLGHHMEPLLAQSFEEQTGLKVDRNLFEVRRHKEHSFIGATPDGLAYDPRELVANTHSRILWEAKNVGNWNAAEWADGVPMRVQIQTQHQMACTDAKACYVCASVNQSRPRFERVERDQEFIDLLIPILVDFWERHVTTGKAPEVDDSAATLAAIKTLHPDDSGAVLDMSGHYDAIRELQDVKQELSDAKKKERQLISKLSLELGDATYGYTDDGPAVSWKTQVANYKAQEAHTRTTRVFRIHKTLPKGVTI